MRPVLVAVSIKVGRPSNLQKAAANTRTLEMFFTSVSTRDRPLTLDDVASATVTVRYSHAMAPRPNSGFLRGARLVRG